ncbi:MAG: hypothetical protein NVSMB31_11140 [Vulcanimicrobiaceae bacterium]
MVVSNSTYSSDAERRLAMVESVGRVGVFEVDFATGERFWSAELRRQFGIGPEAAVRLREMCFDYVHPDDREFVTAAYEEAARGDGLVRIDHRIVQPSGHTLWLHLQATIQFDAQGNQTGAVGTTVDITDRKDAETKLAYLAHYDPLTGLVNRASMLERLKQSIALAKRHMVPLSVLFIDIDGFKAINDTLGHDIGDALLIGVAERLSSAIRETDCVARIGGDEFIVLLTGSSGDGETELVAKRIGALLGQPFSVNGRSLFVTASIGISRYPDTGADVESLVTHADIAMYHAKRTGRNQVCSYDDEMCRTTSERLVIEHALHGALEREEFFLEYQPIVSMSDKRVIGAEALIRWQSPEGLRSPALFIPIAEESDVILAIGDWVLEEACRQAVVWRELGHPICMNVNVSYRQLVDIAFVDRVKDILERTGFEAHMLELELTETAWVADFRTTKMILVALHELGVRIAIDDFGTGYNSLANLRHCMIDTLKIDQSFIREMTTSPNDLAIAGAVIAAGKSMGMRVVAEGVESEAHDIMLQHMGCDDAQGYVFSRPLHPDGFAGRYF